MQLCWQGDVINDFVIGSMRFRAGDMPRLQSAFARQVGITRDEPGCDHYALAIDINDAATMHVSERWRDQLSMGAHVASDQVIAFSIDQRESQ